MRKGVKAAIIAIVCVVVAVAILIGVLWYIGRDTTPVNVISVTDVGMSGDNFGGMNYYYGPVRSDNIQSVFVSDSQIVTEVLVKEGQAVKKGDPLLRYDTTLSDIQLERAEISVKQAQLALENARKDLDRINGMKPYTPPPTTEPTTEGPTKPLVPAESLPYLYGGKGTLERPYRILWSDDLTYDDAYILSILGDKTEGWFAFEIREQNAVEGELHSRFGLHVTVYTKTTPPETRSHRPDGCARAPAHGGASTHRVAARARDGDAAVLQLLRPDGRSVRRRSAGHSRRPVAGRQLRLHCGGDRSDARREAEGNPRP